MSYAVSPGPLTSTDRPVLIFDLDGTILSDNSYPRWVGHLLCGSFGGLTLTERFGLSLQTAMVLAPRKLGLMDHASSKQLFQTFWAQAVEKDADKKALHAFVDRLDKKIRPAMREILRNIDEDSILATAAPEEYAAAFGQHLGFSHILCSQRSAHENVREKKRDNVLNFLQEKGWADRPRIFFTDHEEDLPLIRESDMVFWYGTNARLKSVQARVQTDIVQAANIQPADIFTKIGLSTSQSPARAP